MSASPELLFHISTGTLGLASGAAAMAFRKGSRPHRAAGNVFFVSMFASSASVAYISSFVRPFMPGVVEGLLAAYWVATAWATVMRGEGKLGWFEYGAVFVAMTTAGLGFTAGFEATNSGTGLKDGVPGVVYFVFGGLAALSAGLDVRVIERGGISGASRIVRHLWRMSSALLLASANLFIGNAAKVFPAAWVETKLLFLPVLLALALLIFWLIRVRFTNWYAKA